LWDTKSDIIDYGDNLRTVTPSKVYVDEFGFTHYIFNSEIFHNPKYTIPDDNFELFRKFMEGGSREYPSDGNIPVDIAANEARLILDKIKEMAENKEEKFHEDATKLLNNGGILNLVRGAIKLYLGNLTTRDWRRKRSTDDIDFWIPNLVLLDHVLTSLGWKPTKNTKEWAKTVRWKDRWSGSIKSNILIASNNLIQKLNFGSGEYLEGPTLKNIIKKKLKRGFDVDLSDVINVAIVDNIPTSKDKDSPWSAIEECANMRDPRVTSNLISLCRYAYGIAFYIKRVAVSLNTYKETIKNPSIFTDENIIKVCKISSHWLDEKQYEAELTRKRIYNNLVVHERRKLQYSKNLYNFINRVLGILNTKYEYAQIIFEISFF